MQTNVALDAHGNPLPEEEEDPIDGDVALENGDYGERERLTSNVDDDADDAHDEADDRPIDRVCKLRCLAVSGTSADKYILQGIGARHVPDGETLFSVDDDDDDDEAYPKHVQRQDSAPPPYPGDEPQELHDIWQDREDRHA